MRTKSLILLMGLAFSQLVFATGKEVKIGVHGMVCAFCAQGITKKFKAETAVESVDVNLGEKRVTLKLKDQQDIPDERIKEILTDSGFNLDKIERKAL